MLRNLLDHVNGHLDHECEQSLTVLGDVSYLGIAGIHLVHDHDAFEKADKVADKVNSIFEDMDVDEALGILYLTVSKQMWS